MSLKALVLKSGFPQVGEPGSLLGVHDVARLPPVPTIQTDNGRSVEIAEYVSTDGQQPGEVWDPVKRDFVATAPEAPDPIYEGEAEWYLYVAADDAIVGTGQTAEAAPSGTEAVRVQPFPTGEEDWNPETRRFEVASGVRALLLRRTIPTLLRRLSEVNEALDRVGEAGVQPPLLDLVLSQLTSQKNRLLGYLHLCYATYAQAGQHRATPRRRGRRAASGSRDRV